MALVIEDQCRGKGKARMCTRFEIVTASIRLRLSTAKSDDQGAEIFEFALVLPLLLSLLLGIFWMARAYNIYQTITRAAREGARQAVAPTCASCGNARVDAGTIQSTVFGALTASSLDTTKVTSAACPGTLPGNAACADTGTYCRAGAICIIWDYPLNPGESPPELGVVVSLGYPVDFPIPFVNLPSITVSTQVQMREE